MSEDRWLLVTFVRPDGMQYEVTGQAETEIEAIRLANELLEYVEKVGINDYLQEDGLTVTPPASLTVEPVEGRDRGAGFGLVITDANGCIVRK